MKKTTSIILSFIMILSLFVFASCGGGGSESSAGGGDGAIKVNVVISNAQFNNAEVMILTDEIAKIDGFDLESGDITIQQMILELEKAEKITLVKSDDDSIDGINELVAEESESDDSTYSWEWKVFLNGIESKNMENDSLDSQTILKDGDKITITYLEYATSKTDGDN